MSVPAKGRVEIIEKPKMKRGNEVCIVKRECLLGIWEMKNLLLDVT